MGKSVASQNRQISLNLNGTTNGVKFTSCDSEEEMEPPEEVILFENQVGGHVTDGKNYGMMKYKGAVLKPLEENGRGERELQFYEMLQNSLDSSLKELKNFVPRFYGKRPVRLGNVTLNCLALEDLTEGFKEPCAIDIKIGKRTWSPNASYDKVVHETEKYQESKRDLGFCIPGMQVYKLSGKFQRLGKDFGKRLNKCTTVEALKMFLNGDSAWCRSLLLQILVNLWRIQNWSRKQTNVRLYSSSILIVYDARRLRQKLENDGVVVKTPKKTSTGLTRQNSLYRPISLAVLDKEAPRTGFSGQFTAEGPILNTPRLLPSSQLNDDKKKEAPTLKRTHSYQNDYDKDLQNIKEGYATMLEDLVCDDRKEVWAAAKMIDFAHAYVGETGHVDHNYLDGIENLVKIFESFLTESDT